MVHQTPKKPPPPAPLHTLQREKDKSLEDNVLRKFNTFLSNSKYWILNQKCIPILFKKKVSHVNLELRETQCRTLFNLTVVCMDNKQSKLQQRLGVIYFLHSHAIPCTRAGRGLQSPTYQTQVIQQPPARVRVLEESLMVT